jgi:hypothetical protein
MVTGDSNDYICTVQCETDRVTALQKFTVLSVRESESVEFTATGKGKVVSVLFITEHHDMEAYWGNGIISPCIL